MKLATFLLSFFYGLISAAYGLTTFITITETYYITTTCEETSILSSNRSSLTAWYSHSSPSTHIPSERATTLRLSRYSNSSLSPHKPSETNTPCYNVSAAQTLSQRTRTVNTTRETTVMATSEVSAIGASSQRTTTTTTTTSHTNSVSEASETALIIEYSTTASLARCGSFYWARWSDPSCMAPREQGHEPPSLSITSASRSSN